MAPADLLQPLEGQRQDTLRVIDSLTTADLEIVVRDDGRTVRQLLCHIVDREHAIETAIGRALAGEIAHLTAEERARINASESDPPGTGWDLARIRAELVEARQRLRLTFESMKDDDLDLPVRWPEWPARTIRTSIPYMLEHEDSHMDALRETVERERRLVG